MWEWLRFLSNSESADHDTVEFKELGTLIKKAKRQTGDRQTDRQKTNKDNMQGTKGIRENNEKEKKVLER